MKLPQRLFRLVYRLELAVEVMFRFRARRCGERVCTAEHVSLSDGRACPTCKARI